MSSTTFTMVCNHWIPRCLCLCFISWFWIYLCTVFVLPFYWKDDGNRPWKFSREAVTNYPRLQRQANMSSVRGQKQIWQNNSKNSNKSSHLSECKKSPVQVLPNSPECNTPEFRSSASDGSSTVRKSIARVLTVMTSQQRTALRNFYDGKKYLPLDLRPKKTRAQVRLRIFPADWV